MGTTWVPNSTLLWTLNTLVGEGQKGNSFPEPHSLADGLPISCVPDPEVRMKANVLQMEEFV